ncbi:hypothetical protein [Hansschlegelia sp.]|uniref:hypothetical protein n=1 Tax=Hansschlegelia sp. TaxID=2041892 RepID=UPI002CD2609F|nr:hypothetical protein [Hansschlegelia sp.]HVI30181.1 hypothetical protein [Hansschlegelia sp.]
MIPEQWDTLPFHEVLRKSPAKNFQVQTTEYQASGSFPVVDQGQESVVGYSDRSDRVFRVPQGGVVVFGDHTCIVKHVKHDFIVGADGTQILSAREGQMAAFHALALSMRPVESTGYNRHFKFLKERIFQAPPLPEQKAIVEALSDVDASIAALSRLIAKKRDLRQGAMQRLLTGQTRLPGFTAAWEEKRLGDHVAFLKNGIQSRAQLTLDDPVRYLHYGDIHVSADLCLDLSNADMPRLPSSAAAGLTRLQDGDVVFVDASEDLNGVGKSLEIVGANGIEAVSGQHTIAARFDKSVLGDGFKRYLQFIPAFTTHLRRLAAGTKVYATNRKHIASAELRLPETDEQIAIARVLSDMELEISALELRLNKTRALKQAMMQALLTGRVRLPVRRDAAPQTKEAAHA